MFESSKSKNVFVRDYVVTRVKSPLSSECFKRNRTVWPFSSTSRRVIRECQFHFSSIVRYTRLEWPLCRTVFRNFSSRFETYVSVRHRANNADYYFAERARPVIRTHTHSHARGNDNNDRNI